MHGHTHHSTGAGMRGLARCACCTSQAGTSCLVPGGPWERWRRRPSRSRHRPATAYWLIAIRNPTIRGWATFHRHAAAKEPLVQVATALFKALGRWARRRHPKPGKRWVTDRDFGRLEHRRWRFCGTAKDHKGQTIHPWLCLASATPVTRRAKMKGDCNPYDPAWEIYLEERLGEKCEAKVSRTVLRAGGGSNPASLTRRAAQLRYRGPFLREDSSCRAAPAAHG